MNADKQTIFIWRQARYLCNDNKENWGVNGFTIEDLARKTNRTFQYIELKIKDGSHTFVPFDHDGKTYYSMKDRKDVKSIEELVDSGESIEIKQRLIKIAEELGFIINNLT